MTQFRSKGKGKERHVYPIRKRQPFGVTRNVAYEEVMALREKGKRARLIETNTRLDLYAPYESVIQAAPTPETPEYSNAGANETNKQEVSPHIVTITQEKERALKLIGLLSDNGKLQMSNEQLKDFFSDARLTVENGEMHYTSVDPSHIMMIDEIIPTSLPNGFYHIEQGENKRFTLESGVDPAAAKFKMPNLDYDTNSWKAQIDGTTLVKLMDFLKKSSKDDPFSQTVTFRMKGNKVMVTGFNEKEAGRERQLKDSHSPDNNTVPILEINAQPSKGAYTNDDAWHTANFSREALGTLIKTMMAKRTVKTDTGMSLTLNLKEDYPVGAMIRRIGPSNERIVAQGLLAPRME